jgi:hypothetical protein
VQEEWAYADRFTDDIRTIDIVAESWLQEDGVEDNSDRYRLRPRLNLIVECKQSGLPYVFFLGQTGGVPDLPLIAGLHSDEIIITTDDDKSKWLPPMLHTLELQEHPFVLSKPTCSTFSKAVRKGGEVVLSGSEAYNSLIMPLMSAMFYFKSRSRPPETAYYFDAHLVIGLGVLDAPMVGVRVKSNSNELVLLPWVRVLRHEPRLPEEFGAHRGRLFGIDVVHKDFLQSYLDDHAVPFAKEFKTLALKHHEEIASGKAFVSGMGEDSWRDLEDRLRPRTKFNPIPKRIPPEADRSDGEGEDD